MTSYKSTVQACYAANFTGALTINLTPILFIPLKIIYGLSYTQFGILLATNFITQVCTDIGFSHPVDKYGYRPFLVLAPILSCFGYGIFMFAPYLFENPFHGFFIGTILFSATGGLLELLLSPIVNGIPGEQKATLMSVLHSFYGWGQLSVVLLTTLALKFLGIENWQWIVAGWMILPAINFYQFITCTLPPQVREQERQGARFLLRQRAFYVIVAVIVCSGMTEVTMSLWTSAFLERAMQFPKIVGDTLGMCLFAALLATGRLLYGIFGEKIDIWKVMFIGALFATVLYLVAALSPFAILSLIACVLCGFAVSLLWPGSIVLAGARFPLAGAWMYAMLAAGGDTGASIGPYLVGIIADHAAAVPCLQSLLNSLKMSGEEFGLRVGFFISSIFPLIGVALLLYYRTITSRKNETR